MTIPCVFLSDDPMINDVWKCPENRHLCRCAERVAQNKQFSDRFVGNGPDDCDVCPFYKSPVQDDSSDNK